MIRQCIPISQLSVITKRLQTPAEVEKYFPGFMAFIYCTEQQIQSRPVDNDSRKLYYSGKKKKHTLKNQLIVNTRGIIIHKSNHKKGKRRDYDIYKKNRPVNPKQVVNALNFGYLGVEKDFPEQLSALPYKKKRNQDLSQEEKEYNNIHSKKRIEIEHTIICRLKKYRIMNAVFRDKLRKYNKISDI